MAAVDADGEPLTPGLLYGDARGRVEGQDMANPAGNGEAGAFMRWCAHQAPGAAGIWPAQAVAARALGADAVIDSSTASTTWPLFDGHGWNPEEAVKLGVRFDQLPSIVTLGHDAGRTAGGLVLAPGTVDALAEQIVSDCQGPGDVMVMLGTTLMTWALTDSWGDHAPLWCIPWHLPGVFVVGGPSNAGGLFMDFVRRLLGPEDRPVSPERIPVWAPYLRGERVPLHTADMRGHLVGLDLTMGPSEVRRASFEASGFVVRDILERGGLKPQRIVATGGGTRVPAWTQALADCTGLPVHVSQVQEGGALGAAWLGRMALGAETSLQDAARWAGTSRIVEPAPEWAAAVDARYEIFRAAQEAAAR
jgi:xylulokinase